MHRALVIVAALAMPAAAFAQYPQQVTAPPPPLYVRLAGPAGMKVTFYRGGARGQTFDLPCVAGFRPGYRYRIELSGMPGRLSPQASAAAGPITVCPTFDVLGSLRLNNGLRPSDHPATIYFTEDDLAIVRAGAVVSKVVLLERPETAIPVATKSEFPLEITVPPSRDPMLEAQQRGRPLLVLNMGERQATPQELAALSIPGTVLLPGEKVLPAPRDPPCFPWMCYPLVDPISGLPSPCEEVCFHDGGDCGLRAGIGPDGRLVGLDPSDTVAQYTDSRGNKKIAVSNKVCLCVPRYLLVRTAITPASNTARTGPGDTHVVQTPAKAQAVAVPFLSEGELMLAALASSQKASGIIAIQQAQAVGRVEGLVIYAHSVGVGDVTGKCLAPEPLEVDKPLIIIKWPDKCDLQIGDVVTFTIRYKNQGQRPITGIIVSDSLTSRLQYVPGSARSDRDALFTIAPNEADSAALHWEISGTLPPGEMGTVSFEARVR